MKILHIEAGKNLYGGALQVLYLVGGLKRLYGDDVENVLICPTGCDLAEAASEHATVYAMEMKGDLDFGLKGRIQEVIRKEKPDLVHVHSRRGADIWGPWAALSEGVPVICSRRVDNPEPNWLAKFKYGKFNKVITISEGIRQVLLNEGVPAQHVVCVHSAVDTEQYNPEKPAGDKEWFQQEFGFENKAFDQKIITIANFAQMIERKGQETLMQAFSSLVEEFPNARLMLFGKGPKFEQYQAFAESQKIKDKVIFPGFRNDIARILPHIDIVAHPATMEGLGVALLQSAACGAPIVATAAGGIPEIVQNEHNGFLIEIGDVQALTDRLKRLLQDELLRHKQGLAGREKVLNEFSIDAMAAGNYQVYQQVYNRVLNN